MQRIILYFFCMLMRNALPKRQAIDELHRLTAQRKLLQNAFTVSGEAIFVISEITKGALWLGQSATSSFGAARYILLSFVWHVPRTF